MTEATLQDLFGEVIHTYTRRQAIEDGVLVQLSGDGYPAHADQWVPDMCREAGFLHPIAVTSTVFFDCIALTDAAERACNDIKGRLWDVLWMLKNAIRLSKPGQDAITFELRCVVKSVRPSRVVLKCVCGPDDTGEPCLTIMYPHED